ncbi:MAG: nuclear transport factor 2 family protein [Steroidobacteraceae bacterium]
MNTRQRFTCLSGLLLLAGATHAHAAAQCDRACLEGFVDRYFDALLAHDPARVPLAAGVRYTEDGQQLAIGDGLWRTMHAKGHYRLFVSDPRAGQVAFFGTIEEDNRDPAKGTEVLMALRLRVQDGKITEIEELMARDEKPALAMDGKTVDPIYLATVPAAQRVSRAQLIATANKYFSGMQQNDGKGDYPFADDCNRLENGMQTTNAPTPAGQTRPDPKTASSYSAQWSCMEQFKSGLLHFVSRIRDRRYVAVDEERGIVFAFGFFDHEGGDTRHFATPDGRQVVAGPVQPWTWEIAELFKVQGGKIHRIQAVLQRSPYGMNSGWSTWPQGMSDQARDVTMQ